MTAIEKRKFLELIDRLVRHDLLSDKDVNKILDICEAAIDSPVNLAPSVIEADKEGE